MRRHSLPHRTDGRTRGGQQVQHHKQLDRLQAAFKPLTGRLLNELPTHSNPMAHTNCPVTHEPGKHCAFCINLRDAPRSESLYDRDVKLGTQCPCAAYDARGPGITARDGRRRVENMAGIDPWDFEQAGLEFADEQSTDTEWIIPAHHRALRGFTWQRTDPSDEFLAKFPTDARVYAAVIKSGQPNYKQARLPLAHGLNMRAWRERLRDFHDTTICDYLEFGFPVGFYFRPNSLTITSEITHRPQTSRSTWMLTSPLS